MLDSCVHEAYRTGFTQSLIIHILVLLVLALVVIRPESHRGPIALALQFASARDADEVLDLGPIAELPMMAETSNEALDDAAGAEVVAAFDSPADIAVSAEHEDLMLSEAGDATNHLDIASTDLFAKVRLPLIAPTSHNVLRGPERFTQATSLVNGNAGGVGIDGEMGRRLQAAGAKTGDVQVSIRWDNVNDIDVHVKVEAVSNGQWSLISWMSRLGRCGGMLDVDANAHPAMLTPQPVENVFWGKGQAPYGRYTVVVHHYRNWAGPVKTPVEVAVLVDGQVQRFQVNAVYGAPPTVVTSFARHIQLPIQDANRREAAGKLEVLHDTEFFAEVNRP